MPLGFFLHSYMTNNILSHMAHRLCASRRQRLKDGTRFCLKFFFSSLLNRIESRKGEVTSLHSYSNSHEKGTDCSFQGFWRSLRDGCCWNGNACGSGKEIQVTFSRRIDMRNTCCNGQYTKRRMVYTRSTLSSHEDWEWWERSPFLSKLIEREREVSESISNFLFSSEKERKNEMWSSRDV